MPTETKMIINISINRDYDDYSFDDTTPSPNYNPGTPGYNQESPSASYTPATPGSVYNSQEGYSPYQPSPSPTGGYQCKYFCLLSDIRAVHVLNCFKIFSLIFK